MVPEAVRTYLIHDLEATPRAIAELMSEVRDWDRRDDPERFSAREMVAHLADWEPIWQERIKRILMEENPFLPSVDEGEMAKSNRYECLDGKDCLRRYVEGRVATVELLRSASDEAWRRPAHREFVGDVDLFQLAVMMSGPRRLSSQASFVVSIGRLGPALMRRARPPFPYLPPRLARLFVTGETRSLASGPAAGAV